MRVGFPGGQRLQWYDRNPSVKIQAWNQLGAAPHASTTRWTYTVPSGKKAFLEFVQCTIRRITAASAVGFAISELYYTPSGGSSAYFAVATLETNTVGDRQECIAGNCGVMLPGDQLQGISADLSTGGTVSYFILTKIMEFSA